VLQLYVRTHIENNITICVSMPSKQNMQILLGYTFSEHVASTTTVASIKKVDDDMRLSNILLLVIVLLLIILIFICVLPCVFCAILRHYGRAPSVVNHV
jgi:hypothetical protein